MRSSKKAKPKDNFVCDYCEKSFKYESERLRHQQSHVPRFECNVCSKKFSFVSALRRHKKQHERKGSVLCNICSRYFKDEVLLNRHIKYAHKETHQCSECSGKFNSEMALRTHMKTHEPESERKYRCMFEGCTKSFNFPHHLKHHQLTHTNEKQHFCSTCGKGFIQSHHLKAHIKTHDPYNWLFCTVPDCKKRFPTEYARKRHLVSHRKQYAHSDLKSRHDDAKSESNNNFKDDHLRDAAGVDTSDEILPLICEGSNNNVQVDIDKKVKISDECKSVTDTITNCKTALGFCIVSGDSSINDNCLCEQISHGNERNKSDVDVKIKTEITNLDKPKTTDDNENNLCEGCECSSVKASSVKINVTNNYIDSIPFDSKPKIEYRNDGVIKLMETFDDDIASCTELNCKDVVKNDLNFIPYNSCKDILGNCIVSGNSSMGEGCLCAKMALDDEQMISQEIDDITPRPTNMAAFSPVIYRT